MTPNVPHSAAVNVYLPPMTVVTGFVTVLGFWQGLAYGNRMRWSPYNVPRLIWASLAGTAVFWKPVEPGRH